MKKKMVKRILSAGLMAAMALTLVTGCGGKGDDGKKEDGGDANVNVDAEDEFAGKNTDFTWWIQGTDGVGEYYEKYEENPVMQFINQQYWNVKEGGIGTEETGRKLNFSFLAGIGGSEAENFNTMIGTGEYPEILDLARSSENAASLYENGVLMDITEYVEKYMPNYMALLDANPELKPLVQVADEEGNAHYYAIYSILDGVEEPWGGMCYRRDWVVKYAEPTEYVWDWESEYVKENGHPAVTPLAKAVKEDNLEGWKENEVTSFSATPGSDPNEDYTDNVIFPSGTADPVTISDWEWMFEAFDKAIKERNWEDDSGSYGISIQYFGYSQLGDIVSSFGGGTGTYYLKDGTVSFDGVSENFHTYLECMQTWYENGWLDQNFNTRAGDVFFQIDATNVSQGKIGMWYGLSSTLGAAIRTTCQNAEDKDDAYVMGAALPINDMYGTKEQMYAEPDALYQSGRKGNPTGITVKAEDKDLAALFTYFDWTYTEEGGKAIRFGLNAEQYASVKLDPDLYADYDIETAYTESVNEDGKQVIKRTFNSSDTIVGAAIGQRADTGLRFDESGVKYEIDTGAPKVNREARGQWAKYLNTGNIMDYNDLLEPEETALYSKINTAGTDYQAQSVPNVIKGTMSWEDYVKGFDNIDTDSVVAIYQKYVDAANADK